MASYRIGNLHSGLLLATALSVLLWPAAGRAYTPEQEQACTGDAFRLCSAEIPDVDRVTACMVARKSATLAGMPGAFQAWSRAQ